MKKEVRTICYDEELNIETYHFEGILQPFPNHFHDYYVIGLMEAGTRYLSCRNQEYTLAAGDILLFNPNDNHGCSPYDDSLLDYRCFNIPQITMMELTEEITGNRYLPVFSKNVVSNPELTECMHRLHQMIMTGSREFEKEELLLFLLSNLIEQYGQPFSYRDLTCGEEIECACAFMQAHFMDSISLTQLCRHCNVSKSTLLRAFTKSKGVTPYRYLQTIRINKAKELLEQGITPIEAAQQTGFSDQSHFTHFFHMFIGISPAAYRNVMLKED